MLTLLATVCLLSLLLLIKRRRLSQDHNQVEAWVHQQLDIASFRYAGDTSLDDRLHLRAAENRRLVTAFSLDNALTTTSQPGYKSFRNKASTLVNRKNRKLTVLYSAAEAFMEAEVQAATRDSKPSLRLAESVRCMVLAIVLLDSFQHDPFSIPRDALATITEEINKQWLRSKHHTKDLAPSELLNSTIASLNIRFPFPSPAELCTEETPELTPPEILSLLIPQYETLWRVVLLTFVTAYHHQPQARDDTLDRAANVPSCLDEGGDPVHKEEALKLAKEGLRLFPSNKHLYRSSVAATDTTNTIITTMPQGSSPDTTTPVATPVAADLSALHRHPAIWTPPGSDPKDALAFRPSRFDSDKLNPLQRQAYIPFSVKPHRCPAARGDFGEKMVLVLVVALGRVLSREGGRMAIEVDGSPGCGGFGKNGKGVDESGKYGKGKTEKRLEELGEGMELPTGRDAMEGWVYEFTRDS